MNIIINTVLKHSHYKWGGEMKRLLISMCVLMFFMTSCQGALPSQGNGLDEGVTVWKLKYNMGDGSTIQNASKKGSASKSKQTEKPQNFNSETIREIIGDTSFETSTILKSCHVEDGLFVLALSPKQKVSLRKLDLKGKVLWTKDMDRTGYSITEITKLNNGSIAFGVSDWPNTSMGSPSNKDGTIYCFDPKGRQLWAYNYKDIIGCRIKFIFQDKSGNLLCVGLNNKGDSLQGKSDVVVTQISSDGVGLGETYFGGSDSEFCEGAAYDEKLGLVFTGWSLSHDGEFAVDSTAEYKDYVACVDEMLKLKWVYNPEGDIRYRHEQIQIYGGLIGLSGMKLSNNSSGNATLYFHVINNEGRLIHETMVEQARFPEGTMCITDDQKMVFVYNVENGSKILIKNLQGKIMNELHLDLTNVEQVITVSGGGFIIKHTYTVGYIPQSISSSRRLMDTATTLSCYDSNCQLLWRKTYDDYQGHVQKDYIYIKQ